MKTFLSLISISCCVLGLLQAEDEKKWHGFLDLGIEYDSNPQQYGDTAIIDASEKEDIAYSAFLNLDYNYKPGSKWIARHVLSFYERRFNKHDDLNFRAVSLSEDFRTPLTLFNRKGYFQGSLRLNYYSLDDQDFLWGQQLHPQVSLLHLDQKGSYRLGAYVDQQSSLESNADDFEGDQWSVYMGYQRKFDLLKGSMLNTKLSFLSYQPENLFFAYDETLFSVHFPILWTEELKSVPYISIYQRDYDPAASSNREDDGVQVGLTLSYKLFEDLEISLSGESTTHDSNISDESFDKEVYRISSSYSF